LLGVIILAAGAGKRMKSDKAKVLHRLAGRPMVDYVIETVRKLQPAKIAVVVGNRMEQVISHLKGERVIFCVQERQRGTADAVLSAHGPFMGFGGQIIVICGDTPLLRTETIEALLKHHIDKTASATVLTAVLDDPAQYGRIIRDTSGNLERIVEFADADEEIRAIAEVNSGTYIFEANDLWPALEKVDMDNMQGEFYLTDVIEVLKKENKIVAAMAAEDNAEILGINSVEQLKQAEKALAARVAKNLKPLLEYQLQEGR